MLGVKFHKQVCFVLIMQLNMFKMAVFVFKYNTLSLWMVVYYDDIIGLGRERTIGSGVWIGEIRSIRSWIAFHNGVQLVYICKQWVWRGFMLCMHFMFCFTPGLPRKLAQTKRVVVLITTYTHGQLEPKDILT